jgi:predicted DNA repair protein MutK
MESAGVWANDVTLNVEIMDLSLIQVAEMRLNNLVVVVCAVGILVAMVLACFLIVNIHPGIDKPALNPARCRIAVSTF